MAIVELKNGALRDTETNRFVKGGKVTTAIASSSQGREMANRRYEKARDAIRQRVLEEVRSISDIPADTPEDAYAFVVGKQTVALIDSDKPRFDDVEKLGHLMGAVERRQDKEADTAQGRGADAVLGALLIEYIRTRDTYTNVIEGELE